MKNIDNWKAFKRILLVITFSEMKARYRNTFAGVIWVIINPILIFLAHAIVFRYILKINMDNYFIFLLSGILPWIFISSTLNMGIGIFVNRGPLLKSFKMSPFILLWSRILDNLVNFFMAFFIIFICLILQGNVPSYGFIYFPVALIFLIGGTFSMLFLGSVAQVFYRDVLFINQFILSLVYLLTPIFYPESMIPLSLRWLIKFNPFYAFIKPFQICMTNFNGEVFIHSLFNATIFIFIFLLLGVIQWRKKIDQFYLRI